MNQKELLIHNLSQQLRTLSTETILFHETVANKLGLHVTDHKCLDILATEGAMPSGELAKRTGLTNGAITFVVDRLEKKGLAMRAPDPKDRRRVIVTPIDGPLTRRLQHYFIHLDNAITTEMNKFNQEELQVVINFATTTRATLIHERQNV